MPRWKLRVLSHYVDVSPYPVCFLIVVGYWLLLSLLHPRRRKFLRALSDLRPPLLSAPLFRLGTPESHHLVSRFFPIYPPPVSIGRSLHLAPLRKPPWPWTKSTRNPENVETTPSRAVTFPAPRRAYALREKPTGKLNFARFLPVTTDERTNRSKVRWRAMLTSVPWHWRFVNLLRSLWKLVTERDRRREITCLNEVNHPIVKMYTKQCRSLIRFDGGHVVMKRANRRPITEFVVVSFVPAREEGCN